MTAFLTRCVAAAWTSTVESRRWVAWIGLTAAYAAVAVAGTLAPGSSSVLPSAALLSLACVVPILWYPTLSTVVVPLSAEAASRFTGGLVCAGLATPIWCAATRADGLGTAVELGMWVVGGTWCWGAISTAIRARGSLALALILIIALPFAGGHGESTLSGTVLRSAASVSTPYAFTMPSPARWLHLTLLLVVGAATSTYLERVDVSRPACSRSARLSGTGPGALG